MAPPGALPGATALAQARATGTSVVAAGCFERCVGGDGLLRSDAFFAVSAAAGGLGSLAVIAMLTLLGRRKDRLAVGSGASTGP